MGYFISGATGFIGRHVVADLAKRGEPIWILTRAQSHDKFARLVRACGSAGTLLTAVNGDLTEPLLGISALERRELTGRIDHFFHLGALYDLHASDADLV